MAVTVKELKDYTETELKAELKHREDMKGGWAKLILNTTSGYGGEVVKSTPNGCRVTWPQSQQYMMPSGHSTEILVKKLAQVGGYFWLGSENGRVYMEIVARGPVPQ